MTFSEIRETMTKKETEEEMTSSDIIVPVTVTVPNKSAHLSSSFTALALESSVTPPNSLKSILSECNVHAGKSLKCIILLLQNKDLLEKREELQENKEKGKSVHERSEKFSKISGGIMYKNGSARIGKDTSEHYLSNKGNELEARHLKTKLEKEAYLEMKVEEQKVLAANK